MPAMVPSPQEDARCHRLHAEPEIPPALPSGGFLGGPGNGGRDVLQTGRLEVVLVKEFPSE